jgi:cell wall-associated NlpC family hydrolase
VTRVTTPARPLAARAVLVALLLATTACAKAVLEPEPRVAVPPPVEDSRDRGAVVARMAAHYLGTPYAHAGMSPSGFDCSGLVTYVFAKVGVSVPHNAAQQYGYGTPVARADLRPGDLVFFDRLRHNGIYLGDGKFIHATTPGGVKISSLDNEWFRTRWVGARRL